MCNFCTVSKLIYNYIFYEERTIMGKSDIKVKQFLRNKKRFADLFNGTVFEGEQIVKPEELEEIDSEVSIVITDKTIFKKVYKNIVTLQWYGNKE